MSAADRGLERLMTGWVGEASDLALQLHRRTGALRFKRGREVVTEADQRIELLLRERIGAAFPDDTVIGEEFGGEETLEGQVPAGRVWQLDPIDGTLNFALGLPGFCTSIACLEGGRPVAACIAEPVTGDRYTALRGGGARRNGETLSVSDRAPLAEAVVSLQIRKRGRVGSDPQLLHALIQESLKVRKVGAVALEMAWVAAGAFDALVAGSQVPVPVHDVAAGWLLVEEAGGRVSGLNGTPWCPGDTDLVVSNGHIHDELLGLLGGGV
ncbi:MAG: inositol monophosphatase [bacterium]|nr:inositol monophosphatase [bacterium]